MADVKKPIASSKIVDKWKMKKWYRIVSPQMFGAQPIAESVAVEDSQLIGRTVSVSLSMVTGDSKKQNTNAVFEVNKVDAGNAYTVVKRLEIAPSSIRRMMRKGKDRIDLSMVCATKDNVAIRIKPFLVAKGKIGKTALTNTINLLDAILRVEAHKVSYEQLIRDVVTGKVQREIRQRLNKIYPLKAVEIRVVEKTVIVKPLPPIPVLPEIKEERIEETEEEKVEKKVKAHKEHEVVKEEQFAEVKEEKVEKKAKKAKQEA